MTLALEVDQVLFGDGQPRGALMGRALAWSNRELTNRSMAAPPRSRQTLPLQS